LLFSDEAFYEFLKVLIIRRRSLILPNIQTDYSGSFSKTMGLAGLRIGYAISSEEIIRMMMRVREPFPVNRLAQVAAMATLDDKDFIQRTLEINRDSRLKISKAIQQLGLKCIPGQTNFIFIDLGQPVEPIWNALFSKGIIVRRLDGMNLPTGIRICLGKQQDLQFALNGLAEILGKPAPIMFPL
jgi:histidinol-phosphate aminotransferase